MFVAWAKRSVPTRDIDLAMTDVAARRLRRLSPPMLNGHHQKLVRCAQAQSALRHFAEHILEIATFGNSNGSGRHDSLRTLRVLLDRRARPARALHAE